LFYSYTINQIQTIMTTNTFQPGEFANQKSEVVENLIVKAGKSIPLDLKIPG